MGDSFKLDFGIAYTLACMFDGNDAHAPLLIEIDQGILVKITGFDR